MLAQVANTDSKLELGYVNSQLDKVRGFATEEILCQGNGLQNLRECVIETKWKYDVAPEEKQVTFQNKTKFEICVRI